MGTSETGEQRTGRRRQTIWYGAQTREEMTVDDEHKKKKETAGDEMAFAIPTDNAATWALRITLDGLKRRHERAFQRAVRAEAELDAARRDMAACETQMKDVAAAVTLRTGLTA